jgi:hypothetical protein
MDKLSLESVRHFITSRFPIVTNEYRIAGSKLTPLDFFCYSMLAALACEEPRGERL